MSRFTKLLLVFGLTLGAIGFAGASTAQAGDFCHGPACNIGYGFDYGYQPHHVHVAPTCFYKVFYYDHCHGLACYGTFTNLHVAQLKANHLELLGYHTIVKTIH